MQQENLKWLKLLVILMGVVLIGGGAATFALLWKKLAEPATASDCAGGQVDLKDKGTLVESTVEGDRLRMSFDQKNGKTEMVFIDICSGKVTGKLVVETSPVTIND